MKLTLSLESSNAAFEDSGTDEVSRLLREAADGIDGGNRRGYMRDYNGNSVGYWELSE